MVECETREEAMEKKKAQLEAKREWSNSLEGWRSLTGGVAMEYKAKERGNPTKLEL